MTRKSKSKAKSKLGLRLCLTGHFIVSFAFSDFAIQLENQVYYLTKYVLQIRYSSGLFNFKVLKLDFVSILGHFRVFRFPRARFSRVDFWIKLILKVLNCFFFLNKKQFLKTRIRNYSQSSMIGRFFFAMEISTLLTTLDPSHDFPYRGHIGFISQKSLQIMAASLLKVAAMPPRKKLKLIFTFDFFKYFIQQSRRRVLLFSRLFGGRRRLPQS